MSNNATVAFNHADPLSYSGTISGSGQLVKLGSGTLDLVGSGTYSGPTTISAGTLGARRQRRQSADGDGLDHRLQRRVGPGRESRRRWAA